VKLTSSPNLAVTLSCLKLLLKPAQRMISQRSLRQQLMPCQTNLHVLSQKWDSKFAFSFYRSQTLTAKDEDQDAMDIDVFVPYLEYRRLENVN
jgi:hypothetical protein